MTDKSDHILSFLTRSIKERKIIFPVQPLIGIKPEQVEFTEASIVYELPFSYFGFMFLVKNAIVVITSSGDIGGNHIPKGVLNYTMRKH